MLRRVRGKAGRLRNAPVQRRARAGAARQVPASHPGHRDRHGGRVSSERIEKSNFGQGGPQQTIWHLDNLIYLAQE